MIPQLLSFGTLMTQLANNFGVGASVAADAKKVIDGASTTYNVLTTGSLSASAAKTLIAPMVAIEDTLIHAEWATDIMTVINMRDIKDALTHLAMQGQVNGIKISQLVESINPRRAGLLALRGAEAFGVTEGSRAVYDGMEAGGSVKVGTVPNLSEYTPLAVGRTVEASVMLDGTQVTFPLNFRQVPMPISSNDLQTIFEAARPEDGMFARFMMWRAGELTNPEFLMGTDQIKKEFNIRKDDMSGYYAEATDRAAKNRKAALTTGIASVNTQANTIVMSADTARNIELELGVRFDGSGIAKIRKAVLANTIVVCDEGMGIFTFYSSATNIPEVYTRREITVASKKDTSMDLQSLMKMFGGR
ncbi:putative capsid and scaffold protein [Edwardsiella phage pEt-SU]|uniref:Putative capsid and scaffold protein n=1 Tax=Edwardsiella phage pEt-SU TaxID=2562142 RepID=A0A4D6DW73_9CAUD|nr:putative capsid and scaffold protein [Edwardsiella phage pEt-SU]QBZ70627.1 putative capsid and scaffold protein [Edwardsiella phage pEt-SU]